jgi:hypothetical protein
MRRSLAEAAQMQSRLLTEPMRSLLPSSTACAALEAAEKRGRDSVTETPRCPTFLSPESRWRRRGPKGRIELAVLPGLHLARRGFWGALFSKSPEDRICVLADRPTLPRPFLSSQTEESRPCRGTGTGPTPYSCLAPPRFSPLRKHRAPDDLA